MRKPHLLVVVDGLFSPLEGDEYDAVVTRAFEADGMGNFDTIDEAIRDLRAGLNRCEGVSLTGEAANLICLRSVKVKSTEKEPQLYWDIYR